MDTNLIEIEIQKSLPNADNLAISLLSALEAYFSPDIQTPTQWFTQHQQPNSHVSGEVLLLLYMLYHAMLDWCQYVASPEVRQNQRLAEDIPDWIDGKCGAIPFEWVATALCPHIDLLIVRKAMKNWLKNPIPPARL